MNLTLVKFLLFLNASTLIEVTFFPSIVEGISTSYKLTTHYESKIGIGISSSLDKYVLIKGKIIENLNKDTLCRTQIRIKLDNKNDINYFLTNPLGNHHIVVYEDYKKLEEYLNNIIKY